MKCTYCRRTDGKDDDKPRQCMCYTWFVYTCSVCLVTFFIGLACCVYCTCLLVSINKTIKNHEDQVKGEVAFRNNGSHEVVAAQEYITQKRSTHAIENSLAQTARIRRKRNKEEKKEKKRRKGNGGKGKKKQRTQAAHYVLRKGLADGGANCQTDKVYGPTELRGTLDVFKLASFIKTKSNPFHEIEGRFIAKKRGLYLVYAQIMFEDCKPHEVMKIVQKRKNINSGEVTIQEHFCIIGAPKTEKSYNNTCAMTSLFFLETDDYLTVVNYYPEVHINLGGNGTFFGAVYLR